MTLQQTITGLEGRADDLEKEAVELRKENSWLKEMVILKGSTAREEVTNTQGEFGESSGSRGMVTTNVMVDGRVNALGSSSRGGSAVGGESQCAQNRYGDERWNEDDEE